LLTNGQVFRCLIGSPDKLGYLFRCFIDAGEEHVLHIGVKDIDHLPNLGLDRITSQAMVVSIETSIVYDGRIRKELHMLLA